jgi:hypothetical protein
MDKEIARLLKKKQNRKLSERDKVPCRSSSTLVRLLRSNTT